MNEEDSPKRVAIILIGNELLSGKIQDENGHYAARRLRGMGASLTRISVIPDEADIIEAEVNACSTQNDVVITSGGVGPTHDDITLECIASAFGGALVTNPTLSEVLERYFGERITPAHRRMSQIPDMAELIEVGPDTWPIVKVRNVFVLPGVPEAFRAKFEALADQLRSGQWYLRSLYLNADEGSIAALLQELEDDHGVTVGSYPKWRRADHKVRITIEARRPETVNAAVNIALSRLPADTVVRLDEPL